MASCNTAPPFLSRSRDHGFREHRSDDFADWRGLIRRIGAALGLKQVGLLIQIRTPFQFVATRQGFVASGAVSDSACTLKAEGLIPD